MKKSNIALIVLAGVFITALLGNVWYHRVKLDERRSEFERMTVYRNSLPGVKVVWATGAEVKVHKGYTLHNDIYQDYLKGSDNLCACFYQNYRCKRDTLFVNIQKINSGNITLDINLPNVEYFYQNGKLVQQFGR